MSKNDKPHFTVSALALDGEHWKRIGVAWLRRSKSDKKAYLSVALDFLPNGRELTIWPVTDKDLTELADDSAVRLAEQESVP